MPRCHTTTSSASITFITSSTFVTSITSLTSGTGTYSSPALSAWAVAGGGCQRDGVGTECGFAIEHGRRMANFMARYRGSNRHYSHVECAYAELERYLVLNCNEEGRHSASPRHWMCTAGDDSAITGKQQSVGCAAMPVTGGERNFPWPSRGSARALHN